MKVALSFPGCHRRGGVERIVYECASFLAGRGHDVTVLADDWEADPGGVVRYQHVPIPRRPSFLRGHFYHRRCTAALRKLEFDVLNTHGCVCPTGGVHWVQSIQAAWLETCRRFRPPWSFARIRQRLNPLHPVLLRLEERHFARRAYRKVIATTEQVRDDLNRFYGVPADDVVIIPNGFSPTEFNPARRSERRDAVRRRLGLRPDDLALLFVANELDRKGYDTILQALRILGRPDAKLLAVGRPPVAEVMRRAAAASMGDAVIACGPTSDVSEYHAAADAFVLPTQYEAFCLAILEALGSGLPVVTSSVPGARDAILPGVNGYAVDDPKDAEGLADALRKVLDRDVLDRLSAEASLSVARYQWPKVLAEYEAVLLDHARPVAADGMAPVATAKSVS